MKAIVLAALIAFSGVAADFPRPVGDIDVTLPDGKKLQFDSYRGKVVCLAFIVTT
jgi:hypothetical protein